MSTATIWRLCPHCGTEFGQPDDPGRKRRYCSDACKQAAYRARRRADHRTRQDGNGHHREHDRARQRQQAQGEEHRDQQAREEAGRREQRYRPQPPPSSGYGHPFESAERARARRIIDALLRKAERTNFPHEAAACRAKAEELRRKYGL